MNGWIYELENSTILLKSLSSSQIIYSKFRLINQQVCFIGSFKEDVVFSSLVCANDDFFELFHQMFVTCNFVVNKCCSLTWLQCFRTNTQSFRNFLIRCLCEQWFLKWFNQTFNDLIKCLCEQWFLQSRGRCCCSLPRLRLPARAATSASSASRPTSTRWPRPPGRQLRSVNWKIKKQISLKNFFSISIYITFNLMVSSPFSLHPLIQVPCQYISSLNTNILLKKGGTLWMNDLHRKYVK